MMRTRARGITTLEFLITGVVLSVLVSAGLSRALQDIDANNFKTALADAQAIATAADHYLCGSETWSNGITYSSESRSDTDSRCYGASFGTSSLSGYYGFEVGTPYPVNALSRKAHIDEITGGCLGELTNNRALRLDDTYTALADVSPYGTYSWSPYLRVAGAPNIYLSEVYIDMPSEALLPIISTAEVLAKPGVARVEVVNADVRRVVVRRFRDVEAGRKRFVGLLGTKNRLYQESVEKASVCS